MYLRRLEIRNFRSLEHAQFGDLKDFNVLVGRNNSGKSAVFLALRHLAQIVRGQAVEARNVLTANELTRRLEWHFRFDLHGAERTKFISLLCEGTESLLAQALLASHLVSWIEYKFGCPPGQPTLAHLREIRIASHREGESFRVQRMPDGDETVANPRHFVTNLVGAIRETQQQPESSLERLGFDVDRVSNSQPNTVANIHPQSSGLEGRDPAAIWLYHRVALWLGSAFFFDPVRRSTPGAQAQGTMILAQDGSNLAVVLNSLAGRNRRKFAAIEHFVHDAIPDMGMLHAPLQENSPAPTVSFDAQQREYSINLGDMGSGIEQLLMVATVLETTGPECALFVEEPESHIHPRAQRYLLEQLRATDRQIFVTTHSPVFVNGWKRVPTAICK